MPHFAVLAEPHPFLLPRKQLAFTPSCIEPYQYGTKAAKTSTSISTSIQRPARKGNQEANRFLVLDPVDELTRRSLLSGKAALCDQHNASGLLARKVAAMSCASSTIAVPPYRISPLNPSNRWHSASVCTVGSTLLRSRPHQIRLTVPIARAGCGYTA